MWHRPLATAIAQGDLGAVGAAFDRHGQELYDYCQSQLGDVADAAEVVEATFIIAAARASLLQNTARLRAWLFAIARRGCQQRLRGGARPAYRDEVSDSDWDRLGGTAWRSDLLSTAWAALAEMSPADREVAELSLRHGLDTAELADVLGVPRGQAETLTQSSGDRFEALWDLLIADCRGRSWYCETAAGYLIHLNGDLTRLSPRWMKEHTPRCEVCTKREELNPGSALVLGLLPAAMLAADEREHLLWVLSEPSADMEAYCTEVVEGLGPFGPDGYPGRATPRPVRRRGKYTVAASAAAVAVVALGAGAVLVEEHSDAQNGLQPTAGTPNTSPSSTQPGKPEASTAALTPGKHSASTPRTSGSPSPQQDDPLASSPSSQRTSPQTAPSHSSSPTTSPSPSPTTPSPTPSPTPTPSPSPTPTPTPTASPSPTASPTPTASSTPTVSPDPTPDPDPTPGPTPTSS
jgi:RNA polymerase sigma factor (sigma-70 family)